MKQAMADVPITSLDTTSAIYLLCTMIYYLLTPDPTNRTGPLSHARLGFRIRGLGHFLVSWLTQSRSKPHFLELGLR